MFLFWIEKDCLFFTVNFLCPLISFYKIYVIGIY